VEMIIKTPKSCGSSSCLRSTQSPHRCLCCDRPRADEIAHLPFYRPGIFCAPLVCRQINLEAKQLELFDKGA
jgi:hypothetical protein